MSNQPDEPQDEPIIGEWDDEDQALLNADYNAGFRDGEQKSAARIHELAESLLVMSEKYQAMAGERDGLAKDRQSLLEAIPECATHGQCMPHALRWIGEAKAAHEIIAAAETESARLCGQIEEEKLRGTNFRDALINSQDRCAKLAAERDELKQHDQRLQILCAELCAELGDASMERLRAVSMRALNVQERIEGLEAESERLTTILADAQDTISILHAQKREDSEEYEARIMALISERDTLNEKATEYRDLADRLDKELSAIDAALAGRSALDDLKIRAEKVWRACDTAARLDRELGDKRQEIRNGAQIVADLQVRLEAQQRATVAAGEAIKAAGAIVCNSTDGVYRVTVWFDKLENAQALHKLLVETKHMATSATPAHEKEDTNEAIR